MKVVDEEILKHYTVVMTGLLTSPPTSWVCVDEVSRRMSIKWLKMFTEKLSDNGASWIGQLGYDEEGKLFIHPNGLRRVILKAFSDSFGEKTFRHTLVLYYAKIESLKVRKINIKSPVPPLEFVNENEGKKFKERIPFGARLNTPTNSSPKSFDSGSFTPNKKSVDGVVFGCLQDGTKFVLEEVSTSGEPIEKSKKRKLDSKIILKTYNNGKLTENKEVGSLSEIPSDATEVHVSKGDKNKVDVFLSN